MNIDDIRTINSVSGEHSPSFLGGNLELIDEKEGFVRELNQKISEMEECPEVKRYLEMVGNRDFQKRKIDTLEKSTEIKLKTDHPCHSCHIGLQVVDGYSEYSGNYRNGVLLFVSFPFLNSSLSTNYIDHTDFKRFIHIDRFDRLKRDTLNHVWAMYKRIRKGSAFEGKMNWAVLRDRTKHELLKMKTEIDNKYEKMIRSNTI